MGTTLITGGAGFLGSHLAEYLLSRGERVLIIDDISTGTLDNLPNPSSDRNLEVIVDSVLNEFAFRPLVERAERVFHLAAVVGVKQIINDPVGIIQKNISTTETVLRICADYQRPVFLASSSEVYGKSNSSAFAEEDDLFLGPSTKLRWSYACSKAMGEFLGQAYVKQHGLPVVIARFFNAVGPRQSGEFGMVIPRLVAQALSGQAMTVYGDGSQSRCFCHVVDLVAAGVRLMETTGAYGEVINLGGDRPITIRRLADLVKELTGSASRIVHIPFEDAYEPGFEDMQHRKPDLSRARALIGFAPRRSLRDVLVDVIDYQRQLIGDVRKGCSTDRPLKEWSGDR